MGESVNFIPRITADAAGQGNSFVHYYFNNMFRPTRKSSGWLVHSKLCT